jgi:hypothetical protein
MNKHGKHRRHVSGSLTRAILRYFGLCGDGTQIYGFLHSWHKTLGKAVYALPSPESYLFAMRLRGEELPQTKEEELLALTASQASLPSARLPRVGAPIGWRGSRLRFKWYERSFEGVVCKRLEGREKAQISCRSRAR